MNNIVITGRLTADPVLSTTQGGANRAHFTVAVDRNVKGKDGNRATDFIPCTAWNQSAEFVSKYFKKGDPIEVAGSLNIDNGTDKEGNKRTYTNVMVNQVHFVSGAAKRDSNAGANNANAPAPDLNDVSVGDDLPF